MIEVRQPNWMGQFRVHGTIPVPVQIEVEHEIAADETPRDHVFWVESVRDDSGAVHTCWWRSRDYALE